MDTDTPGDYTVTYNVADAAGNDAGEVTRTVTVADTKKPLITLTGAATATVECGGVYTDAGATAADDCYGDLSASIVVTNPVDTATPGDYTVRFNVTDPAGNAADEVTRAVTVSDTTPPAITVIGPATVTVHHGAPYNDQGARAADVCDGDLSADVVTDNPVDTNTLGEYTVRYNVSDAAGNAATEATRTVNVIDTDDPIITLLGDDPVTAECGEEYTDAGATAWDDTDGDLTAEIQVDNPVDTATPGEYTVRYNVSDSSGNPATEVTRTVNVVDSTPPLITVTGDNPVTVECGSAYTDAGATASDTCDGDLTADIVTDNPVDAATPGEYTVRYNVTDAAGNTAVEATRTVNVVDSTPPLITPNGVSPVAVECGAAYVDAGATASDACDGNLTANIATDNPVNTAVPGVYTVRYNVADAAGNAAIEVTRTVSVADSTPPLITRNGNASVTVECGAAYNDAGATASDVCDGDLSANIVTDNPVDTATAGVYTVRYNVADSAGNDAAEVTRTVNVQDTQPPALEVVGPASVDVHWHAPYNDQGARATDACDGDLSAGIVTDNPVDTEELGAYTVTYNVADAAGNSATEATRTVNVIDTEIPIITLLGDTPSMPSAARPTPTQGPPPTTSSTATSPPKSSRTTPWTTPRRGPTRSRITSPIPVEIQPKKSQERSIFAIKHPLIFQLSDPIRPLLSAEHHIPTPELPLPMPAMAILRLIFRSKTT